MSLDRDTVDTGHLVEDAAPPAAVLRVLNPILRLLLRLPTSRLIKPLALAEFTGRKTGERRRVVVGWHRIDDIAVVVTPAAWRANFIGGRSATVRRRGSAADYSGTLVTDPDVVAATLNTLLANGTSPRSLALRMPAGHHITADDVAHTRRALIRFEPATEDQRP
ncbi:MAG TPA: hypothetical protein VGC84_12265 [Ilumatobacteraceae bacterium]|jgi:hypothetical protein